MAVFYIIADISAQSKTPGTVVTRAAANAQKALPLSFFMLRSVVEQGQCIREKSMKQSAVDAVQPFARSSAPSAVRLPASASVPCER